MDSGIYVITCTPTNQSYVGTGIHWAKRVASHINKLIAGKHKNNRLQEAWGKYGSANFTFRLIEECEVSRLLERERYWSNRLESISTGFNSVQLGSNGHLSHGQSHKRVFRSWDAMKQRCTNPKSPDYPRYGAAGVVVCERWLNSFENFLADMGERPTGTSLDRYPDKRGNYEPGNCRWATPSQQQRNLRSNQYLTIQGETKLLVDWAREYGIDRGLLRQRYKRGARGLELLAKSYFAFEGVKDADGQTVTTKRQLRPPQTYTAHGKTLTLAQWAVELGISEGAINQRINKYKIPLEEALIAGNRKKGKEGPRTGHSMVTAFGKTLSITAWSRETGIPVSTLRNRLVRANMSPEDAF